jgi:hypothetical protein
MEEVWKPIPGYEGIYEASNLGRIRTANGKTTSNARYPVRVWQQRVLKPKVQTRSNGRKDQRVNLWKDGVESTQLVARLVAMSFLPMPFDKLTVNHINGNPMDNRIENLEWCTLQENINHAFEIGLQANCEKAVVLESTDGHELYFKSMSEASRYLERNTGYVSGQIARCAPCYDNCGVKYWARLTDIGGANDA